MRRILGGLAVFLGILALVLGMRADSIYDQLATVPLDQKTTAESEGTGVSALRVAAQGGTVRFDKLTDQHVKNTRTIIGLPGKVPEGQRDDNAFWQIGLRTEIVDGQPLSLSTDSVTPTGPRAVTVWCRLSPRARPLPRGTAGLVVVAVTMDEPCPSCGGG